MSAVTSRYADAYAVADTLVRWGRRYKILGRVVLILSAVVFVLILVTANPFEQSGSLLGGVIAFGVALVIAGFGLWSIARGVLMSAQGQLLLAQLDTAVHTSPFLTETEKSVILGVATGAPASNNAPSGSSPAAINCRRCGITNPSSNQYCEHCGAPLGGAVT